jgi:uncharacterized membrane protein YbhN (UPF0104 family)
MSMVAQSMSASPDAETTGDRKSKRRRIINWVFGISAIVLAGWLIHRTLSQYSVDEIITSVQSIPFYRLGMAGLFAALSYFCLTFFDYLGLRYVKKTLPYPFVALASFTSLSLGHSIGFAGVSSGAIRYRYYERWGLKTGDVAKVVLICGGAVAFGLLTLGGIALLVRPDLAAGMTKLSEGLMFGLGFLFLAIVAAYLAAAAFLRTQIRIKSWTLEMPPLSIALGQVVIGTINFTFVAACLHQVLLAAAEVNFFETIAAYVIANSLTMLTHVPGGLGVIESTVMYLVPGENLIGPLLAFRAIYFFAPLGLGLISFAISEFTIRRRKRIGR